MNDILNQLAVLRDAVRYRQQQYGNTYGSDGMIEGYRQELACESAARALDDAIAELEGAFDD